MSDILIKNMKMPENCVGCPLAKNYGMCAITKKTFNWGNPDRLSDCPLIEISPHGRLIDADALDDSFTDLRWTTGNYKTGELAHWGDRKDWCLKGQEIERLIKSASTIIEAEAET